MTLISANFKNLRLLFAMLLLGWIGLYAVIMNRLGFSWTISIYDSLVSNILLAMSCLSLGNIIKYYQPSKRTAWKLIIWCLFAAIIWSSVSERILYLLFTDELKYLRILSQAYPIRFAIGFLTIGCVVLIVWVWEFIVFKNEDAMRQASAIALAKEAELSGITQQLQPHFLFNSLNSINALIGSRSEDARKMIQQLSDFLRGTLKKDDRQFVNLEDELKHLQLYLDIEKVRFGHRLSHVFNIDEEALAFGLPPLILQPIIENAIKFGLYDTVEHVEIKMNASVENNYLIITVQNPFDPKTSSASGGTGFGLKSVKRRLYLIYARIDLLQTNVTENLFTAVLTIPKIQK